MDDTKRILSEIRALRRDVIEIRKTIDPDTILTPEERRLLAASYENQRKGSLVPSAKLRKELGTCGSR